MSGKTGKAPDVSETKKEEAEELILCLVGQKWKSAAAIVSAQKKENNKNPAGITAAAVSTATVPVVSPTSVAAQAGKNDDPENTTAGVVSESGEVVASAIVSAVAAAVCFTAAATVCSFLRTATVCSS